jgi:hypothetical protein
MNQPMSPISLCVCNVGIEYQNYEISLFQNQKVIHILWKKKCVKIEKNSLFSKLFYLLKRSLITCSEYSLK